MLHSGPFWLESWSDLALWGLKVAMEKSLFVAPRQIRQISVLAGQGDFPWDYYMNILYTLQYIYIYVSRLSMGPAFEGMHVWQ